MKPQTLSKKFEQKGGIVQQIEDEFGKDMARKMMASPARGSQGFTYKK
jgi:hypothetical protein